MAQTHSHAGTGHGDHVEPDEIHIGAIFKFVLYLTIVTVVTHIYVWYLMGSLNRQATDAAVINYPLAQEQGERLPPLPRLQTQPKQDLADLRAGWARSLEGYSWVDKHAGSVRLPIELAKKRVLEAGIPTRAESAPAAAAPAAAAAPRESAEKR